MNYRLLLMQIMGGFIWACPYTLLLEYKFNNLFALGLTYALSYIGIGLISFVWGIYFERSRKIEKKSRGGYEKHRK